MQVFSWLFDGVSPRLIQVEYHARFQIPSFSILGLPGPEIQEARERIIAAFHASEIEFPKKRLIINLAPASMKKWGTGHDLPIALAILSQTLDLPWPSQCLAWGELGLLGEIKPRGQMAALVELLLTQQIHTLILTSRDAQHFLELVQWRIQNELPVPHLQHLICVDHLKEVSTQIRTPAVFAPHRKSIPASPTRLSPTLLPLSQRLERTLDIALTGRHHLLLLGPKGIGKSQSLEWLTAVLPPPDPRLSWSLALRDRRADAASLNETPVRRVHSQIRPSHLLGSWRSQQLESGELALAHGGVLIADEFLEWPRDARECLREPLQNKKFLLSRVAGKVAIECDFQFVATGNLCPCGGLPAQFYGYALVPAERLKKWRCRCRPNEVESYLAKLSGPISDRIDLVTVLYEVPDTKMNPKDTDGEATVESLRTRVLEQRKYAMERLGCLPSDLKPEWLERNLPRTPAILRLLDRMPSLRSRHKTARIAYSLQCIQFAPDMREEHIFEAAAYRFMDHLDIYAHSNG